MSLYQWLVFAHLAGVFGFLLSHGVPATAAVWLRRTRDPRAVHILLDLSASTRALMYSSLALLLIAGAWAGHVGGWLAMRWPWAAFGVLVVMVAAVAIVGVPHFRALRKAAAVVGVATLAADSGAATETPALDALLASPIPLLVSGVGLLGLLVILWLMVAKPV